MVDNARADYAGIFRDPRIKIDGRRCVLCNGAAPVGLVLVFMGQFTGDLCLCASCILKVVEKVGGRSDAVIRIDIGSPRTAGGIVHA